MEEIKKEEETKEVKKVTKKAKKEPKKEEVEAPRGFTKKTNLNKKEYGYYNGRKYQVLKNGYGMWADTGTAFVISELK